MVRIKGFSALGGGENGIKWNADLRFYHFDGIILQVNCLNLDVALALGLGLGHDVKVDFWVCGAL